MTLTEVVNAIKFVVANAKDIVIILKEVNAAMADPDVKELLIEVGKLTTPTQTPI